jgi:enoyl-CoA hydratase
VDGGTQRLPRLVGQGNALWLVESGARIDAPRALAMGLVQEVVGGDDALPRALELAQQIAAYPQSSLRADRAAVLAAWGRPLAEGFRLEADGGLPTAADPEMQGGLARFLSRDRRA